MNEVGGDFPFLGPKEGEARDDGTYRHGEPQGGPSGGLVM
jgi:hypothetical protein